MKKFIIFIILLGLFVGLFFALELNRDKIAELYREILYPNKDYIVKDKNKYYRDYDFIFVQNTNKFIATNEQDIYNILYSGLNRGYSDFEFKCDTKYKTCIKDVKKIANNSVILSIINDYVHPYNSFNDIKTIYNEFKIVNIKVEKTYSKEIINEIDNKIDELLPSLTADYINNDYNSQVKTITEIHNYIINHSTYDTDKADYGHSEYNSDTAYGPLIEGYGLCGGYTDLMELFLERLNIKSYKVTSEEHIWNGLELNNKWYHLDLTWDDPVTNTGEAMLINNYLLIDTNKLLSLDTSQHSFFKDYYKELDY